MRSRASGACQEHSVDEGECLGFARGIFFHLFSSFPLPLSKYEYEIFNKMSRVKEEVERAKYSKLIMIILYKLHIYAL